MAYIKFIINVILGMIIFFKIKNFILTIIQKINQMYQDIRHTQEVRKFYSRIIEIKSLNLNMMRLRRTLHQDQPN